MVIGDWLMVIGDWLMVIGGIGYWLLEEMISGCK
jgi:hypothetical protein